MPASKRTPHLQKVTMLDIAKRCGVSKTTVSLALSRHPRISETTTERIHAIAQEMGYSPASNSAARRLAYQKHGRRMINRVVALFIEPQKLSHYYFSQILHGALDVLSAKSFGLLIHYIPEPGQANATALSPIFDRGDIDGILGLHESFAETIALLRRNPGFTDRPAVSIMTPFSNTSWVRADDRLGAYTATKHLLDLGHRDMLFFTFAYAQDARGEERLAGARQAFFDHGLDPDQHLHTMPHPVGWLTIGIVQRDIISTGQQPAMQTAENHEVIRYLRQHPEITAIMAVNDACAMNAWHLLRAVGYRIPEQISLIGFDDTWTTLDTETETYLTSVNVPLREIGVNAAQILLRRITGETSEDEHCVLPVQFIERSSTAPPPQQ